MGLEDRDYMIERTQRRIARERRNEAVFTWPPKPWVVITACVVLAVLAIVYMF